MLDHLKEAINSIIEILGLHPLIGAGLTGIALLSGIGLEVLPSNNHPHFLQLVSWVIASVVGICTILASLIKWTTLFDNVKWIKKENKTKNK